ncbi:hypothetical protein [Catenulispora acidiphila]|uniref:hypothetical protein n=1 Tax=Catenulispora acidiphila TaxID=304895 RepID=UPI00019DE602|nr:hypothetical protein [Catenulispora acidiphila]
MERISVMLSEIAVRERIAVKLITTSIRVFCAFFVFAFLFSGLGALIRGNTDNAAIFGGIGILLALAWGSVIALTWGSHHAMQRLRDEAGPRSPTQSGKVRHPTTGAGL